MEDGGMKQIRKKNKTLFCFDRRLQIGSTVFMYNVFWTDCNQVEVNIKKTKHLCIFNHVDAVKMAC